MVTEGVRGSTCVLPWIHWTDSLFVSRPNYHWVSNSLSRLSLVSSQGHTTPTGGWPCRAPDGRSRMGPSQVKDTVPTWFSFLSLFGRGCLCITVWGFI